jgi:hypothetical protein
LCDYPLLTAAYDELLADELNLLEELLPPPPEPEEPGELEQAAIKSIVNTPTVIEITLIFIIIPPYKNLYWFFLLLNQAEKLRLKVLMPQT